MFPAEFILAEFIFSHSSISRFPVSAEFRNANLEYMVKSHISCDVAYENFGYDNNVTTCINIISCSGNIAVASKGEFERSIYFDGRLSLLKF